MCIRDRQLPACHTALYYPLCMAVMVLWPLFLWPATHGMPDAFGLTFAAVIALLCADYRFETLPWPRLLAISVSYTHLSPLLETSIAGARGVIINITSSPDIGLDDASSFS